MGLGSDPNQHNAGNGDQPVQFLIVESSNPLEASMGRDSLHEPHNPIRNVRETEEMSVIVDEEGQLW